MRLNRLHEYIESKGWPFQYNESDGCGSIDFEHKGLSYHIWEFPGDPYGAESNLRTTARMEDYFGDYEQQLLEILQSWGD